MGDDFFNLPTEDQLEFIKRTADKLTISTAVIEKDIWICWVLEKIFELPLRMAFKGGTSLSKAFGLIKRFSEDCDVTVDYRNFKPELDFENITRTQIKKISDELKTQLKSYVSETMLPYLKIEAQKKCSRKQFEITLSEDGEQLRFYYPSILNTQNEYLRDHVFIEFGVRNSIEPCEKHEIAPYLADIIGDVPLPKPKIETLSPVRTFWEKATLIHVECHRNRFEKSPERLFRHWYDLYMLSNSWVGKESLSNGAILRSVIEHKKAFFNASYSNYDDCLSGKMVLIPKEHGLKILEHDFKKMIDAEMFYESPPKFSKIIETLQNLEGHINGI